MLRHDFQESIPYHVFTAAHAIERAMGEALEGRGITFRQCQMLGMIAARGSLTQGQVAELMGVEPSSVARLVDRMCRDGWLERRPDPADRRKNRLVATGKAEPIWEQVRERGLHMRNKALRGFAEGEVDQLKTLLRRLRDNLAGPGAYPLADVDGGSAARPAPPAAGAGTPDATPGTEPAALPPSPLPAPAAAAGAGVA